jgi:hypothetical protein
MLPFDPTEGIEPIEGGLKRIGFYLMCHFLEFLDGRGAMIWINGQISISREMEMALIN